MRHNQSLTPFRIQNIDRFAYMTIIIVLGVHLCHLFFSSGWKNMFEIDAIKSFDYFTDHSEFS